MKDEKRWAGVLVVALLLMMPIAGQAAGKAAAGKNADIYTANSKVQVYQYASTYAETTTHVEAGYSVKIDRIIKGEDGSDWGHCVGSGNQSGWVQLKNMQKDETKGEKAKGEKAKSGKTKAKKKKKALTDCQLPAYFKAMETVNVREEANQRSTKTAHVKEGYSVIITEIEKDESGREWGHCIGRDKAEGWVCLQYMDYEEPLAAEDKLPEGEKFKFWGKMKQWWHDLGHAEEEFSLDVFSYGANEEPLWRKVPDDGIELYPILGLIRCGYKSCGEHSYFRSRYGREYFQIQVDYRENQDSTAAVAALQTLMMQVHEEYMGLSKTKRWMGQFTKTIYDVIESIVNFLTGADTGFWGKVKRPIHLFINHFLDKGLQPQRLQWCLFGSILLVELLYVFRIRSAGRKGKTWKVLLCSAEIKLLMIAYAVIAADIAFFYSVPEMTPIVHTNQCYGLEGSGAIAAFAGYSYKSYGWLLPILIVEVLLLMMIEGYEQQGKEDEQAGMDSMSGKVLNVLLAVFFLSYDLLLFLCMYLIVWNFYRCIGAVRGIVNGPTQG